MSESQIQAAAVKAIDAYFAMKWPQMLVQCRAPLYSVPNEGKRTPRNGARMNAQGRRKGIPDLFLAVPDFDTGLAGLYIEMKKPGGKLSPDQRDWRVYLETAGYGYTVAESTQAALDAVIEYMEG